MTHLTLSFSDDLLQKVRVRAETQDISLEQFITNLLQQQVAEYPSCKPTRIGRYRSGRRDVSTQAKALARQLMRKKHERHC